MKILIITDAWHPQVNGVVRTYEHLSQELVKRGHNVKIIGPTDFPVRMPMIGYSEIKLAVAPDIRLGRIIAKYMPDQIHIATEGPLGRAARFHCIRNKIAFTTAYHTHFPDYMAKRVCKHAPIFYGIVHKFGRYLVRKFHKPSSCVMVATKSLEEELRSWRFKSPMASVVRGANLDIYYPPETDADKSEFKDLKRPIALYVGRIAIEKNLEDFLKMDWDGSKVIVGEGPQKREYKRKYPTAHFVGVKQREELAAHYRSSDVFVFPSRTDTFGIVLIEALACGLPVAGYNVTGPKDIITAPFLGAIHETDLSLAAKQALKHGTATQRAAHIKNTYSWEIAAKQFEQALQKRRDSVHNYKKNIDKSA